MTWKMELSKRALKDSKKAQKSEFKNKIEELLKIIKKNPFQNPPPYEKLEPPKDNIFSRRINSQHRLVYHVNKVNMLITITSLWTHYE